MEKNTADVLKHLADKLDIPVQQLWDGLVAYAPFEYYQWITGIVVALVVMVVAITVAVIFWRKAWEENSEAYTMTCVLSIAGAIVALLFITVAGVGNMAYALAAKNAPEAWAARYIIKKVTER